MKNSFFVSILVCSIFCKFCHCFRSIYNNNKIDNSNMMLFNPKISISNQSKLYNQFLINGNSLKLDTFMQTMNERFSITSISNRFFFSSTHKFQNFVKIGIKTKHYLTRILCICMLTAIISLFTTQSAYAKILAATSDPSETSGGGVQGLLMWALMFLSSATLHSAESAITKISPWKVQEFAEEEGPQSPFATLSRNLTRLLSTIVLTTTSLSIYSTALFVTATATLFPTLSLGTLTAILTIITLILGEVFPKALAVNNSELVARKLIPFVSALANVLSPFTWSMTLVSNKLLALCGLRHEEDKNVSEDMLRLVVEEAQRSNEGIETGEGKMIKNVLDMQDKEVGKIMQPRVDMVALSVDSTAHQLLEAATQTKYSRLPIYRDDIDHIVGVVFAKDLLDIVVQSQLKEIESVNAVGPEVKESVWQRIKASELMEATYFIPETMTTWDALQEMRRRRLHLAVVVDEYGGTAGIVTLEDILEEVVGEIYDEDDDEEQADDIKTMFPQPDGSFIIQGAADLDDVFEALGEAAGLRSTTSAGGVENDASVEYPRGEYSTIGGYLCAVAGEIPSVHDVIELSIPGGARYRVTILEVEEGRRVVSLVASPATNNIKLANCNTNSNSNGNSVE